MTIENRRAYLGVLVLGLSALGLAAACGDDDDEGSAASTDDAGTTPPEHTGQSCATVSECYPGIDAGSLAGEAQCLDRVTGGYCTHLCETDDDCCKVEGECRSNLEQVCSPFESTGKKMCFLSCEADDIRAAGDAGRAPDGGELDDTTFCTTNASSAFKCRSSGGGSKNRKVCTP